MCRFVMNVTPSFGNCLKALEYMLFCTICYMVFWSLFEDAKICVVSYHMLHGVLVFVSKSLSYLKIRLYIYIVIVNRRLMSVIEEISRMSKSGYNDRELLEYIYENYGEIECESNGEEYREPKKRYYDLCINCNLEMTIDYQKSTVVYASTIHFMLNRTITQCNH